MEVMLAYLMINQDITYLLKKWVKTLVVAI